jgi:hypothetical protein
MIIETRQIDKLVQIYVSSRARNNSLVSTREAIRTIRLVIPDCDLSDVDLVDKVAHHALFHQCAMVFDCGTRDKEANSIQERQEVPVFMNDSA